MTAIDFKLKNGLKVIFQKNKSSSVSAIQIWVKIGSRDELRGKNAKFQDEGGLAHIHEHMLFQGTKTFSKQGEISGLVEAHGGDFNAWTSYDETVYHITMPSENTELGLKILSSMVSEPTVEEDRLKKELEVVMEEFRRCNDDPHNVLQEEMFKIAYEVHPYHHPIIGYEETIRKVDPKTVLHFFNKYYGPSNMTLVLVSDMDEKKAKKLIENTFGQIKSKKVSTNSIKKEPNQKKAKVAIMKKPFEGTYLSIINHVTKFKDKQTPAVDLLYMILGSGTDSRLNKKLFEEKGLVYDIYGGAYTPKDEGVAFIDSELDSKNLKSALKEIFDEMFKLKNELVRDEELDKVKNQILSEFIYSQQTCQGIAKTIGQFELNGDGYKTIDNYLENIKKITVEDIKKAANKFLNKENFTIGVILPEKEKFKITEKEILDILEKSAKESLSRDLKNTSKPLSTKYNASKYTLANGVRIILRENPGSKSASFKFGVLGGILSENQKNNGITNLSTELLTRGADIMNAVEFAKKIENLGSQICGFCTHNFFGLEGRSIKDNLIETLNLATKAFLSPNFEMNEINKIKPLIIEEIKRDLDSPIKKTFELFTQTLYKDHPYGFSTHGTEKNILAIKKTDIENFYKNQVSSKNIVITIVGDFKKEELIKFLDEKFKDLATKENKINVKKSKWNTKNTKAKIPTEKNQSNIVLGFKGLKASDKEIYALDVLQKVLAGMGGRLFVNLRDQQSLAYSITALSQNGFIENGYFITYLGCGPEKEKKAIEELRRELKNITLEMISDKELIDAKNFLTGYYKVKLQSNSAQSTKLTNDEILGLGFDFGAKYEDEIKKVTKHDVIKVAKRIIDFDHEVLAVVGPR